MSYSQEIAYQILMAAVKRYNQEMAREHKDENKQARLTENKGEAEACAEAFS